MPDIVADPWMGTPVEKLTRAQRSFLFRFLEEQYSSETPRALTLKERALLMDPNMQDAVKYAKRNLFQGEVSPHDVSSFLKRVMEGEEVENLVDPLLGTVRSAPVKMAHRLAAAESLSKNMGRLQRVRIETSDSGIIDVGQMNEADRTAFFSIVQRYPKLFGLSEDDEPETLDMPLLAGGTES
jgi:hypothetical protein